MLINGEKFACEACVRGHRVSSCHHQGMCARAERRPRPSAPFTFGLLTAVPLLDRPLVHVNKKGRPVSQCQHCRGLRKARSQHVKCECHDKAHSKDDCPHEKGDGKMGAWGELLPHRSRANKAQKHTLAAASMAPDALAR